MSIGDFEEVGAALLGITILVVGVAVGLLIWSVLGA